MGAARSSYKLGRYEVRGVLGHGAMGDVYLGWDDELRRKVAIKAPRRDRFKSDKEMEGVLEEARTVAKLRHPNIVSVYDISRTGDGTPFIIMEYVEGVSLRNLMDSEKLSYGRIRKLLRPVAEGLKFAHAAGFVHRDVKPSNILLDKNSIPRLADFGLAIHECAQRHLAGKVAGTIPYMSPEQVRGETHHLDGRADIWALGVVLYEMLAARRPFGGESWNEIVDEILHREPKPPRMVDESIPEDLERICLKCLRKPITERYTTAADLIKDLSAQLGVVNWEAALEVAGGDGEVLNDLVSCAIRDFPDCLVEIRRALSRRDAQRARSIAHTLEVIRIFGAVEAKELATRMKTCAQSGCFSEAEQLLPALEAEVNRVLSVLREERKRQ